MSSSIEPPHISNKPETIIDSIETEQEWLPPASPKSGQTGKIRVEPAIDGHAPQKIASHDPVHPIDGSSIAVTDPGGAQKPARSQQKNRSAVKPMPIGDTEASNEKAKVGVATRPGSEIKLKKTSAKKKTGTSAPSNPPVAPNNNTGLKGTNEDKHANINPDSPPSTLGSSGEATSAMKKKPVKKMEHFTEEQEEWLVNTVYAIYGDNPRKKKDWKAITAEYNKKFTPERQSQGLAVKYLHLVGKVAPPSNFKKDNIELPPKGNDGGAPERNRDTILSKNSTVAGGRVSKKAAGKRRAINGHDKSAEIVDNGSLTQGEGFAGRITGASRETSVRRVGENVHRSPDEENEKAEGCNLPEKRGNDDPSSSELSDPPENLPPTFPKRIYSHTPTQPPAFDWTTEMSEWVESYVKTRFLDQGIKPYKFNWVDLTSAFTETFGYEVLPHKLYGKWLHKYANSTPKHGKLRTTFGKRTFEQFAEKQSNEMDPNRDWLAWDRTCKKPKTVEGETASEGSGEE